MDFGMPLGHPFGLPLGDPFGLSLGDPFGLPLGDPFGLPLGDPFGFTAAGTVTDSNGIPFSFHRLSRYAETNDEIKVRNKCVRGKD
jgi:hypothetical protein